MKKKNKLNTKLLFNIVFAKYFCNNVTGFVDKRVITDLLILYILQADITFRWVDEDYSTDIPNMN